MSARPLQRPALEPFIGHRATTPDRLHQREFPGGPRYRLKHARSGRTQRVAYQRNVRNILACVTAKSEVDQPVSERRNQLAQGWRRPRRASPYDAVVAPVTAAVEFEEERRRFDLVHGLGKCRDTHCRNIAEKGQGEVKVGCVHGPSAAFHVELVSQAGKCGPHLVVGPQGEEESGRFAGVRCLQPDASCARTMSATASAAMPSPRPIKPSFSAVFALILTASTSSRVSAAML